MILVTAALQGTGRDVHDRHILVCQVDIVDNPQLDRKEREGHDDPPATSVPMQPQSTETIWEDRSHDLTAAATGGRVNTASYRLTKDALQFETGTLSRIAETMPLWAIYDVDMRVTLTQRARGVADLVVRVDPAAHKHGQAYIYLRNIKDAAYVRDLIAQRANAARAAAHAWHHQREIERARAAAHTTNVATGVPESAQRPADDLMEKLERLASLHAAGALTAEEFAAAKAKLLDA